MLGSSASIGNQFIGQTYAGGDVFEDALEFLNLSLQTGKTEIAFGVERERQLITGMPVEGLANARGEGDLAVLLEFDRVLGGYA
ncbi:MAG: hypothetical protein RLZZ511_3999 [Cyanobacteriota bacterium]